MKRKLILHIGMWKTGTTTIQETLFENKELLKKEGILYPTELKNHIFIIPQVRKDAKNHVAVKSYNKGIDRLNEIGQQLLDQIASEKNTESTYILSSEFFMDFNSVEIENLKNIFSPYFDDFQIICYLRPPIAHYTSAVNEQVKQGHYPLDVAYDKHCDIDEYDRLDWWAKTFGKDNLNVRIFNRNSWVNNDLIDDFFSALNLGKPDNMVRVKNKNQTLSHIGVLIADHIAKVAPSFTSKRPNTSFLHKILGKPFVLSNELKCKCLNMNKHRVEKIKNDYSIDLNIETISNESIPELSDSISSISDVLIELSTKLEMKQAELDYYQALNFFHKKQYQRSYDLFIKSVKLEKFNVYRDFVCLLYEMNKLDELKPYLKKALKMKPDAPWLKKIALDVGCSI